MKTAIPTETSNPAQVHFGDGVFAELPEVLASFSPKTVLLVLGEKSFRKSQAFQKLQVFLEAYEVIESAPIGQNPKQTFIQQEINRLKTLSYDLVLAIGGGSVLDTAKLFALVPKQTMTDLNQYIGQTFPSGISKKPLIAVPTTSGTGSEVTPYASLETPDQQKITIGNPALYPSVALIDPELTYSMPAYVTASTGFDALSQAIESFWSVHATPASRTHALRGIEMIQGQMSRAVSIPQDRPARYSMALGSCEAGLAIAHTKTTAVHSVSYPITSYFGVAHGHACALTLSEFVLFNAPVMKEEGRPMLNLFGVKTYEQMADKINQLMQQTKLERKLSGLGIDEKGRNKILEHGFRPDRIKNNPRPVSREDLDEILKHIQ